MAAVKPGSLFELRQLRCFVAAAEELHFGRAGSRVNMSQPALSRQIKLLERVMGVKLLERTSRLVKLTPAGRVFLMEARRILRLTESAALATRRTASGETGAISLGFTASSGYKLVPNLISLSIARLPNVSIQLKEMVSADQTDALLTGRIDVGLLRPPVDRPEFDKLRISAEPLVAALSSGDELLAKPSLTLDDFDQHALIMYAPEGARYFRDLLVTLFEAHQVRPHYVQHLAQIHSAVALVQSGLGAALVPETAISLHFENVHFRPLVTEPPNPVELYLVWNRENDNPALPPLLELVRQSFLPQAQARRRK